MFKCIATLFRGIFSVQKPSPPPQKLSFRQTCIIIRVYVPPQTSEKVCAQFLAEETMFSLCHHNVIGPRPFHSSNILHRQLYLARFLSRFSWILVGFHLYYFFSAFRSFWTSVKNTHRRNVILIYYSLHFTLNLSMSIPFGSDRSQNKKKKQFFFAKNPQCKMKFLAITH